MALLASTAEIKIAAWKNELATNWRIHLVFPLHLPVDVDLEGLVRRNWPDDASELTVSTIPTVWGHSVAWRLHQFLKVTKLQRGEFCLL